MEERKHAIAYYRVSTKSQAEEDKFGLEAQRSMVLEYCGKNNYVLDHEYTDVISGAKEERPELDKILYEQSAITAPVLIIAKTDRLSRKMELYFYYKMILGKKGIELVSTQEDFGSMGEFAPMLESFVMFVAEMERNNITKRTKAGRLEKAKKGGYCGGFVPYGYKLVDGKLEIVESEKEVVIACYRIYKKTQSFEQVRKALNHYGYIARSGNGFTRSTIIGIIRKRSLYEGYLNYGSVKGVKGQWEPILKEGEYEVRKQSDVDWGMF